jgi:hypothetical protein
MRVALSTVVALVLGIGAVCAQTAERRPVCFTNELTAFTNGMLVLAAMKAEPAQGRTQVLPLIGSRILFNGNNYGAPRGTNADLNLGKGILLRVHLSPDGDVCPPRQDVGR